MTTPMRQQYLQIKKQYPDTIVLFRLGDFYETFDEDARIVSEVCDIVLTSRPVGKNSRVPLAGVPYHSVEGYIAKLINAGYKVAIVEQSGSPQNGLMTRIVTDVITPGTVLEPTLLEAKQNNYLAAFVLAGQSAGLAYVDISTGEFATTQFERPDPVATILRELDRLRPAECLVPDGPGEIPAEISQQAQGVHFTKYEGWRFELDTAKSALLRHFGVETLEGFGCAKLPLAIQAAGAIVQYIADTRKSALNQLNQLSTYSLDGFMVLDPQTRRNLELLQTIRDGRPEGALLGVLDRTVTPMGARLLRRWLNQPLLDLDALQARLDANQALYDAPFHRARIRAELKGLGDLERLASRAAQKIAAPRELLNLSQALKLVPHIRELVLEIKSTELMNLCDQLDDCAEVASLLSQAISADAPARFLPGSVIARGFSPQLDSIREATSQAKQWISDLEARERERTGIKNLKVGYNQVFGYYIEVTKAHSGRVPPDYIRKQTLVNGERFITPELKEKEALILNAEDHLAELETQIYRQICEQTAAYASRMLQTARALARLDVHAALAEVAAANKYIRPLIDNEDRIELRGARHPVVEQLLGASAFVPNDIVLNSEDRILVITGPNMAGKSTILRQVALIVLMAQIGSFVPADSAKIGLVDRIFTRVGAQDDISAGQSTFMVEMIEVANILNNATPRSLIILDEVGRGTSTYDGISLAWAVVEYLHNNPRLRAKTMFATHYHELTALEGLLPHVRNYNVAVVEEGDRVVFLHKLVPGSTDRSYGIHVAQLAGLPRPVITRAQEILQQLEGQQAAGRAVPRRLREAQQLALFGPKSPVLAELESLDVMAMTPLEAINKLFQLQQRAKEEG